MVYMRGLILFILFFCTLTIQASFEEHRLSTLLEVAEESHYLTYAEYVEVGINLSKAAHLSLEQEIRPYGLELKKISDTRYVLFGRSQFIGKFCFLVQADIFGEANTKERLCLYGEDNPKMDYPVVQQELFLRPVVAGEKLNLSFDIEDRAIAVTQTLVNKLEGHIYPSVDHTGILQIMGHFSDPGVQTIVVKTQEFGTGSVVYNQFVQEIYTAVGSGREQESSYYQCAPGYYWDDYLKHCVQAAGKLCGTGTWYDVDSHTCIAYRNVSSCGPGRFFDHWSNRCIRTNSMRCPLNYEWDQFYSRCVRLPHTCSYGERYSYSLGRCAPLYRSRVCSLGFRWSSFRLSCVRSHRTCGPGAYWNGHTCMRRTLRQRRLEQNIHHRRPRRNHESYRTRHSNNRSERIRQRDRRINRSERVRQRDRRINRSERVRQRDRRS